MPAMKRNVMLAWCVHAYTALGLVIAALIAVLIVRGTEGDFRLAFLLMGLAVLIDATDGWLARRLRVAEVLPSFDGRRLDDIVDFLIFTALPLFLLWRSDVLPPALDWVLLIPLLSSAYGFAQTHAKTKDGFFLGFPSYWNIVAFYIYFLALPPPIIIVVLIFFSVLTFVPSKYIYPTQPGTLSLPTNVFGGLWGLLAIAILLDILHARAWIWLSLAFPFYYFTASWIITLRDWLRPAREGSRW
jgi:phosphatidylcholine synthase